MTWMQIARAYEHGYSPPPRRLRGTFSRKTVTVEGETKGCLDWSRDPRNIHRVSDKTLSKRSRNPENLVSVEVFLREPFCGGRDPQKDYGRGK